MVGPIHLLQRATRTVVQHIRLYGESTHDTHIHDTDTLPVSDQSAAYKHAVKKLCHTLDGRIDGEVLVAPLDRGIYSTDAGNYRVPPAAIVRPKTLSDIQATVEHAFRLGIPITARGAGTSCAGNAIGPGVIVDYSRYFNKIVDIDPTHHTATIQPGVIQGALQKAAAPHGLRFGPDPSTWNRCTIGGMIGNNACGPHATAYGRTADNVIDLQFIDGCARTIDTRTQGIDAITGLKELVADNLALIRTTFGRFNRQVSGYSMEHLLPENKADLAKFFVGTEGTLGIATQATLRLVPLPQAPVLVALGFPDMVQAADAVPTVLRHHPLAVEGMDARLIDVVRHHKGPGAVPDLPSGEGWLMCEVGGEGMDEADALEAARAMAADTGLPPESVMIYPPGAEAAALWRIRADGAGLGGRTPVKPDGSGGEQAWPGWEDAAVPPERLSDYLRDFNKLMASYDVDGLLYGHFGDGCVHVRLDLPLGSQAGVGKSRRFLEDAADLIGRHQGSISGEHGDGRARSELLTRMYPPEAVELFAKVKTLFDPHNRMNPGVITRPWDSMTGLSSTVSDSLCGLATNNRKTPSSQRSQRLTSWPSNSITAQHNTSAKKQGSVESDIDKKSCEQPENIGRQANAHSVFSRAATRHNVHIVACGSAPDPLDKHLRRPLAKNYPAQERGFGFHEDHASITNAVHRCTGVAKCRANNSAAGGFMCPSFQASHEDKDSTRGRARILQEATNGSLIKGLDAREVLEVLDLCLACKACSSDCPAGIDMAKYRSEVYHRAYRWRLRPRTHYFLGWLPLLLRIATSLPGVPALANSVMSVGWLRSIAFAMTGIDTRRKMPRLATSSLSRWAHDRGILEDELSRVFDEVLTKHRFVLLWADSFSHCLDGEGAKATAMLLERLGYSVIMPESDVCCGLTWITTGQLSVAKKKLAHTVERLAPVAMAGIPIVGVEPSCTAVLRDDLRDLLPDDPKVVAVSGAVHTLAEFLMKQGCFAGDPDTGSVREDATGESNGQLDAAAVGDRDCGDTHFYGSQPVAYPDLTGVQIVAQPHCHHYSVMGWAADRELLDKCGASVIELTGCCGLAGNFGMEKGHYEMSVAVAENSLLPTLKDHPEAIYLADGFSCRTQAEQLAGRRGKHLAQVLLEHVR